MANTLRVIEVKASIVVGNWDAALQPRKVVAEASGGTLALQRGDSTRQQSKVVRSDRIGSDQESTHGAVTYYVYLKVVNVV